MSMKTERLKKAEIEELGKLVKPDDSKTNHNSSDAAFVKSQVDTITRLAGLTHTEYDCVRKPEAKLLKLRVATLDHEVEKKRLQILHGDLESKPDVLLQLNEEYAVLRKPHGRILCLGDGEAMTPSQFTDVEVADRRIIVVTEKKLLDLNGGTEWLKWPDRKVVEEIVYEPGWSFPIHAKRDGGKVELYYNRWRGLGVEPAAEASDADVEPFLRLVDHVFDHIPVKHREWLLSWLAYPLQNPGVHMRTGVCVHGEHWIGKSLIGTTMGVIYGENYKQIGPTELFSNFNGWRADKQFILCEEIASTDKRHDADMLKNAMTTDQTLINNKYGLQLWVRNCAHLYITSNHPDPLLIDESEKRYFIHGSRAIELTKGEVGRYFKWIEQGGAAKLLRWLLNYKISRAFNPNTAPLTEARRELADAGMTDMRRFAEAVVEDPYGMLYEMKQSELSSRKIDLWDIDQILKRFKKNKEEHKNATEHALGNALRGTRRIYRVTNKLGKPVLVPNGYGARKHVWVIANFDAWRRADLHQLTYEYQRHFENDGPKIFPVEGT